MKHLRSKLGDIALCGAKARDGAKMTPFIRTTECPTCKAIAKGRVAAAKERLAKVTG